MVMAMAMVMSHGCSGKFEASHREPQTALFLSRLFSGATRLVAAARLFRRGGDTRSPAPAETLTGGGGAPASGHMDGTLPCGPAAQVVSTSVPQVSRKR